MKKSILFLILLAAPSVLLAENTDSQTDMYYDAGIDRMVSVVSFAADYNTAYYSDVWVNLLVYKDDVRIEGCLDHDTDIGYGSMSILCEVAADAGAEYFVQSYPGLTEYYYYYEFVDPCDDLCDYYGDPLGYFHISFNNEDYMESSSGHEVRIWTPPALIAALESALVYFQGTRAAARAPGVPRKFDVTWHSFIPPLYVSDSDWCAAQAYPYPNLDTIAEGDNRGFGRFTGEYNYRASLSVLLDPETGTYSYPSYAPYPVGVSRQYEPLSALAVVNGKLVLQRDATKLDCFKTNNENWAAIDDIHMVPAADSGTHTSQVWMYGTAAYPLNHIATPPGVTWSLSVHVDKYSSTEYRWSILYGSSHDCWPAHEIYVGNEAIYQFPTPANGGVSSLDSSIFNVGWCLAGMGSISVPISGPSTAH